MRIDGGAAGFLFRATHVKADADDALALGRLRQQGAEPEWVYTAMFWCSLSMKSQAAFSPMIWIQA
jgi:hypothetical protein